MTPRFDPAAKIVEIPRPAGVVLALTPSTNPVASVFFKALLALMTRNAVIISPHPQAAECCADAARTLGRAAVAAGAPDGVIQVVDRPSVPADRRAHDRRADQRHRGHRRRPRWCGPPTVPARPRSASGPGNVPVLVDATADLPKAAKRIVDSKSFDNSVLCTNESVLIVEDSVAATLLRHLKREGAHLLEPGEAAKVAGLLFPGGHFDIRFVGRDAPWIASEAGLRVPGTTRVLLAPFSLVVPEEPLAHEKLCPVLGLVQVPNARRGIDAARAVLRIAGRGHSAAIHSTDPADDHGVRGQPWTSCGCRSTRQQPGQFGDFDALAPSMTVGTGFFGRSSLTENLEPKHLVQWTRMAYNPEADEAFGELLGAGSLGIAGRSRAAVSDRVECGRGASAARGLPGRGQNSAPR